MHYIRLLRPAKIRAASGGSVLELLFTITTDLGDSFLCPDEGSLELAVAIKDTKASSAGEQTCTCTCIWKTGMRVQDVKIRLQWKRDFVNCRVAIYPAKQRPGETSTPMGALDIGHVLPWRAGGEEALRMGVIMPATFEIVDGVCAPVSVRTLALGKGHGRGRDNDDDGDCRGGKNLNLQFEEDIGESIARHIWDAGVITSAYLADACSSPESIRTILPIENETSFNVLELGSGVGILGLTIASILPEAATAQGKTLKDAVVLLTDLEEAEERARSNMARAEATLDTDDVNMKVKIEYENLDWDEGREGRFGPLTVSTAWDLVVLSDCTYNVDSLPALVETLSALHSAKQYRHDAGSSRGFVKSSVLLATKPRHSSEEALFGLLEDQSWEYRVVKEIPLPKIGEEDEVVQIYLLKKGGCGAKSRRC